MLNTTSTFLSIPSDPHQCPLMSGWNQFSQSSAGPWEKPVTATYPAGYNWGVNVTDATYGSATTIIQKSTAGIVTGTTLVLANDFFESYLRAIPGAKIDPSTGLMTNFTISGTVFSMDAAAQLIPSDQNTEWGLSANKQYGVVSYLGINSGEGLDFIDYHRAEVHGVVLCYFRHG
ncbi:hypothetical protein P692DRAFT_201857667 [Suillus brevipes Sb2]|nr:hypothetical protein P692DRAFT_201857667 [Suillus brevipes Sb2]